MGRTGGSLPIIGGAVPIRGVLSEFLGGIGGLLPIIIGGAVPIRRVCRDFWVGSAVYCRQSAALCRSDGFWRDFWVGSAVC